MKTALFMLCLLFGTAAFGQSAVGSALSSQVQVLEFPSHAEHATQQSLAQEQSLLEHSNYFFAQGEIPLWELMPLPRTVPLGDVARALRKEHATAKKADVVRND